MRRSRILARTLTARLPAIAVVAALALLATRVNYVPLWDGRIYADCIVDVALRALSPSALRCAEHVSHSYMAFAGAIQMLSPGSYPLILVANALLYLAACVAFFTIVRLAFPDNAHSLGRALLGVAFALHPAILASVVQPTIDFPLLPAFLWAVVFVLRRQRVALVAGRPGSRLREGDRCRVVRRARRFARPRSTSLRATEDGLKRTPNACAAGSAHDPSRRLRRVSRVSLDDPAGDRRLGGGHDAFVDPQTLHRSRASTARF